MKKVIIDNLPLSTGHAVRGMGMYTKNLIESVKNFKQDDFKVEDKNSTTDFIKADLIHYPYFDLFQKTLPEEKLADKVVVTVPDVIPLLFPDKYPTGIKGKKRFENNKKILNQQADAVITITETSKRDIVRLLDYDPEKIFVTYLAPNFSVKKASKIEIKNVTKKYKLPKKFILYVGDVNINKDIQTLAKACNKLDIDLVLVGKQASRLQTRVINKKGPRDIIRGLMGEQHPEVAHFSLLNRLFRSKKIHRLGFVSDEELNVIWNLANLYVQPSLYEGFGMPVLEAMQAGVPVIISKTQALVEISGEAADRFEIGNVDELSEKIDRLVNSPKRRLELVKRGKNHVKNFSWEKQAKLVFEVYSDLLLHEK